MQQNIKPQYIVQKLEGKRKHTIASPSDKGGFDYKEIEEPAGYMVFFPSGSSIRVRTDDELKRLGFDSPANLVDMESGLVRLYSFYFSCISRSFSNARFLLCVW